MRLCADRKERKAQSGVDRRGHEGRLITRPGATEHPLLGPTNRKLATPQRTAQGEEDKNRPALKEGGSDSKTKRPESPHKELPQDCAYVGHDCVVVCRDRVKQIPESHRKSLQQMTCGGLERESSVPLIDNPNERNEPNKPI